MTRLAANSLPVGADVVPAVDPRGTSDRGLRGADLSNFFRVLMTSSFERQCADGRGVMPPVSPRRCWSHPALFSAAVLGHSGSGGGVA